MYSLLTDDVWHLILEVVFKTGDKATLQNLRLTSKFLDETATPYLFRSISVTVLNTHTSNRFAQLGASATLSKLPRCFSYRPYIRARPANRTARYACGAVPDINHWSEQNDVLKKGLENSTILAAINAFANLTTIFIEFPKHGKRNVAKRDIARSLSTMLSCILRRPPPNLSSLSLCELELRDLTFVKKERDATLDYDLGALHEFKLMFSSYQLSAYSLHTPYIPVAFKTQASLQLPAILRCSPNLRRLEIVFDAREISLREANWTSCCFASLQALKICNFDISEQSLLTLIKPGIAKLAELSIDKIYLVEGTWAAIYRILEAQSHDLDNVFELRGREYGEFGRFYEENEEDQKTFRRLFDKIDAKRCRNGQPSMLAPIHTEAMTLTHDFGLMGM